MLMASLCMNREPAAGTPDIITIRPRQDLGPRTRRNRYRNRILCQKGTSAAPHLALRSFLVSHLLYDHADPSFCLRTVTQRRHRILRRQSQLRPKEPGEAAGDDREETGQLAELRERDADEDAGGAAGGAGAGGVRGLQR
jgi:hypothetical protein